MSNRAVRVAWPALTILVATAALLVVAAAGGDDGWAALGTGRPIARLVLVLAAAAALGLTAVAAAEPSSGRRGRLLDLAAVLAGVQTVATGVLAFLLYLGDAPPVSAPAFGPGLVAFLLELGVGRAWLGATVAAAIVSAVVVAVRSRRGAAVALVLGVLALVPVAAQATASGDSLGEARTAVTAGVLRLGGVALTLGALLVQRTSRGAGRRGRDPLVLGGVVVALVGSTSIALLRLRDGEAGLLLLDAVMLLLAAVAVAAGGARTAASRVALLALGVAAGIGAAPALTDPVHRTLPSRTTPAEILTGEALPAPLDPAALLGAWRVDPLLLLLCAALAAGFAVGVVRARAAGRALPLARVVSWNAGVLVLLWVTCGGLAVFAPLLLGALLVQHVALLLVVPLLLAGGAPALPAPGGAVLRALRSRAAQRVADPRLAAALVAVVLLLSVGTGMLRWSVADPIGAELVDLLLLGVGALLVHAVLGADRRQGSPAVAAVLVLLVVEAAGGAALVAGSGLLQADWFGAMGWGTDALAAQRAGAAVGLAVALVPTAVLLAAAVARRARRSPAPRAVRPAAVLVRPDGADA